MRSEHSFIVPAYGDSPFLEDCLRSLKAQTIAAKIVVTTSTPSPFQEDLARRYDARFVSNPQPDAGIAGDWNFAARQCRTPYATLAHQDDIYLPRYAEACLETFTRHPNGLIVFTDGSEFMERQDVPRGVNALVKRALLAPWLERGNVLSTRFRKRGIFAFGNPIVCPSVMFNLNRLRDFAFAADYRVNLDWDAWLRIADRDGVFAYVAEKLVRHRVHAASASAACFRDATRRREDLALFARLWPKPIARLIAAIYALGYVQAK